MINRIKKWARQNPILAPILWCICAGAMVIGFQVSRAYPLNSVWYWLIFFSSWWMFLFLCETWKCWKDDG